MDERVWLSAYEKAHKAGVLAADECIVSYLQVDGYDPFPVCGWAWIRINPGNCKFANWLKKVERGSASASGGVLIYVSGYGQEYDRSKAYARAFADTLNQELVLSQIAPSMKVQAESYID